MENSQLSIGLIWAVAFLAGAIHVLAPDHWIPLSILSWQRGWDSRRTATTTAATLLLHVLSGLLIYGVLDRLLSGVRPFDLLSISIALLLAISLLRMRRFERIRGMTRLGRAGDWAWISAAALLGPAESLVPLLLKVSEGGRGIVIPVTAYLLGTIVAGTALVALGRQAWNRPLLLPRSLSVAERNGPLVPALLAFGIAIVVLIR